MPPFSLVPWLQTCRVLKSSHLSSVSIRSKFSQHILFLKPFRRLFFQAADAFLQFAHSAESTILHYRQFSPQFPPRVTFQCTPIFPFNLQNNHDDEASRQCSFPPFLVNANAKQDNILCTPWERACCFPTVSAHTRMTSPPPTPWEDVSLRRLSTDNFR